MLEQGGEGDYIDSLAFLSRCLEAVYKKRCMILIDEFDVSLENAWFAGFYGEMSLFIRSMFWDEGKAERSVCFISGH